LYEVFPEYAEVLNKRRENVKFLPQIKIPRKIKITSSLKEALRNKNILILAVPSKYLAAILKNIKRIGLSKKTTVLSVIKGFDYSSLKRISSIINKELGLNGDIAVLSGPSHAEEVAVKVPTAVVIAAKNDKKAKMLQKVFSNDYFRVYTSKDVAGVELGGALKNIIALAYGILDGMKIGDNAKAALMTRGLSEIKKLAVKMGASAHTLNGLSGFGDLIVTCTSRHSRNRMVGERIGKGESLEHILSKMEMVAEGVTTTKACFQIAKINKVEMPIVQGMYEILFKNKSPKDVIENLMKRRLKSEEDIF
jgi:glycerol-3-phosphate dehydrogenase (NAD(P)+)